MQIAVRAQFSCEYCGKNLLESVDAYDSWQIDHIMPRNDNSDNEDLENLALSCKTCNFAKCHSTTEALLNSSTRQKKIEEARRIIWERRAQKELTLMKVKEFAHLLLAHNNEKTV
jgi:5-methylcytosine-specific restriction endonuclease McrA